MHCGTALNGTRIYASEDSTRIYEPVGNQSRSPSLPPIKSSVGYECSFCHSPMSEWEDHCPNCGADVIKKAGDRWTFKDYKCSFCGSRFNPYKDDLCPSCGEEIHGSHGDFHVVRKAIESYVVPEPNEFYIAPELYETPSSYGEDTSINDEMAGYCDRCGEWSEWLKLVGGDFLCLDCRAEGDDEEDYEEDDEDEDDDYEDDDDDWEDEDDY